MKLTAKQRAALFHGERPRLTFPGNEPCPVKVGDVHELSDQLRITVMGVRRAKQGEHVVAYMVRDDRPLFLRRLPPTDPEPAQGELDAESIKQAAFDSAYTQSPAQALADAGDALPPEELRELTMDAHKRWAEHQESERAEEMARRDARRVQNMVRELALQAVGAGANATEILAGLERQIRHRMQELERDQN